MEMNFHGNFNVLAGKGTSGNLSNEPIIKLYAIIIIVYQHFSKY